MILLFFHLNKTLHLFIQTGLSNEMLENESPFDENTAKCLNNFLNRMERPICLVAHNGYGFDFPILRYVYDKIEMVDIIH